MWLHSYYVFIVVCTDGYQVLHTATLRTTTADALQSSRTLLHQSNNIVITVADCSCFAEAVKFCFMCFYVFDVQYSSDLRVFYAFLEAVLDVQLCVKSTTVLDLLHTLSKLQRSGHNAEAGSSPGTDRSSIYHLSCMLISISFTIAKIPLCSLRTLWQPY